MARLKLTQDFKEFLNLLNQSGIEYLLIGGYAVGLYGYVRPTKEMDLWVATSSANLDGLKEVLDTFGFAKSNLPDPLFQPPRTPLRMGIPPNRLEVLSEIAGVSFDDCFVRRELLELDGIKVPVIHLEDLKKNKLAAGRARDLADVQQLERRAGR